VPAGGFAGLVLAPDRAHDACRPHEHAEPEAADRLFGNQRFLLQMSVGTMPHEKVLHAIELFGTKVAPIVRREVERRTAAIPMPAG